MLKEYLEVFLIDDDAEDVEIFELALSKIDHRLKLVVAKNGTEAIKVLEFEGVFLPDIIFLDLNMPLISGHDCLTAIKKVKRLKNIPVFIYTTSTNPRDEFSLSEAGAVGFITKPFNVSNLVNILTYILSPKLQAINNQNK